MSEPVYDKESDNNILKKTNALLEVAFGGIKEERYSSRSKTEWGCAFSVALVSYAKMINPEGTLKDFEGGILENMKTLFIEAKELENENI